MTTLSFAIEPFYLMEQRENLAALEAKFANFWAGVTYPARLISWTRRFSFAPIRQRLRQQTGPLDDVREVIPLLDAAMLDGAALPALTAQLQKRLPTLLRATASLRDAAVVQDALTQLAAGEADSAALTVARTGCVRAIWPWRWLKNYRRAYEAMERDGNPLGVEHAFLAWPETHTDPEALRSVLHSTFALAGVQPEPLPPLATGTYREAPDHLIPRDPGRPLLRVLHAYDVRGDWNLASWLEVLGGDYELAIMQDIATLPRPKAIRATTDSYNVLEGALTARNAVKDARAEKALADVAYAMHHLDTQNLHEVAYAILVQAPTRIELDRTTQALRDTLGARLKLDVLAGCQAEYLKFFTATPATQIGAPIIRRNALSDHVAAKTPWGIRKSRRTSGTLWGYDAHERLPIHYDLFGPTGTDNPHLLMLGKAGSGKTVTLGMLALRQAVAGHQVIMLDPVGNCERLCEAVGGGATYYHLEHDVAINVLDPLDPRLARQKHHVERKLAMVLGRAALRGSGVRLIPRDWTNAERGAIDAAVQSPRIYGPDGERLAAMTDATAPLLEDLVLALRETNRAVGQQLADEITDIALQSQAHIFNARTTLKWDFSSDVVAYNLNNADPALLPLIMDHGFAAINAYVRSAARRRRGQKLICVIDEFGVMSQIEGLKLEVAMATKEWRNYGAAQWGCDQNAATYVGGSGDADDYANLTANNTAIKLFGRQEGTDAQLVGRVFGLSPSDVAALQTAGPGEFIGIFGTNEVHHLRIQLTDQETPYFIRKG